MADVAVALVYPDLLGTYGDGGNARVLVQRLRWRGIDAELLTVRLGTPLPRRCDLYVLGGGEDEGPVPSLVGGAYEGTAATGDADLHAAMIADLDARLTRLELTSCCTSPATASHWPTCSRPADDLPQHLV